MYDSKACGAPSFSSCVRVSRIESGSFSDGGSPRSVAHIRSLNVQQLCGLRTDRFQNVALAFARRTFV
eukprot:2324919-Pyramimonas_sp.AAC.1